MNSTAVNSSSGLVEAIQHLDVHDHLCLIYETQEEQFNAIIPFIQTGLERNEKCIYIADDNTADIVLQAMKNHGIDVPVATASGQLLVANKQAAYLKHGFFDPDWMIQFLKESTTLALQEGYSALRVTGEMTWVLGGEKGVERLIEYEAKLNYFFPDHKTLAICQYNLKRFRPELLKQVIETHPKVVVGGWVCKNFYYVPPDEFLHPEHPSREIRRLLDNIIAREAFEKTLQSNKRELENINAQLREENKKRIETELELRKTTELLEKIFSTTHLLIAYLDTSFNFLKVNRAYAETDNNVPEFYVGKNHFDLFPNEENKVIFTKVVQTGIPHYATAKTFEYAYHPERGVSHWDWSLLPVLDPNGVVTNVVLVLLNVTERIRAEEALGKSAEELRAFFNQSIDGCFFMMVDEPVRWDTTVDKEKALDYIFAHQRITQINDAMLEQYGATREQFLRLSPNDLFKHDIAYGRKLWRQFFDAGKIRLESDERKLNGTQMWIEGEYIALYDSEGRITGQFGIQRDITERKRIEDAIRKSEARYRQTLDCMLEGCMLIGFDWTYLYVNEIAAYHGHQKQEDLIGKTMLEMYPGVEHSEIFTHYRRCMEERIPQHFESSFIFPNGRTNWYELSVVPVPEGIFVLSLDITERKQAEELLHQSEEKYRDIVTWAPIGIYQSTVDGKFITANACLAKMLGYDSIGELMEQRLPIDVYLHESDRKTFLARYDHSESDSVAHLEVLWKKKDGTPIWVSLTAHAVRDEHNKTRLYEGFVQDISERKTMEDERKNLEAQLVQTQKLEAIGTLASGIAHDFNNILGIILGYNSLLRNASPSHESIEKSTAVIEGAVQRGAGLVKQILTFARQSETHFGPLDINIISKEISKMLAETFPKTIVISLELEKDLPTIHADPTQVHQVLLNICVNARDAMSSSGMLTIKTTRVHSREMTRYFQTVPEGTYLLLSISDTGCGMSEETKSRIFEPFFTTKEKGKGTGLGLSVVYGIVKSHNGFVRVESTLGKGTTFFLYFPVPKKNEEQRCETRNANDTIVGGTETILLVEDELTLSELTKAFLEMYGYVVLTAKDGDEAIELYRQRSGSIDIVITDMGLPKLTGLEVLIEMKKINPEMKLIFASGYIEPELKSLMFRSGAKLFLFKPYQPGEILQAVRNILDSH
ncbi:MAG: MEDS domain-containing protein [Ignavibacteriae bacterium]|nr:MEDS domain-containing protein [Ignavibacteriota bacterium]